jgi:uncharacterized oxidoreductase
MQLEGHTILITGGGTGIGLALAQALVQKQNTVIICGRRMEKLEAAKQETPELHTIQCDVANPEECRELFERLSAEFPQLSILVNNAGTGAKAWFRDGVVDMTEIRNTIATNLTAPVELSALLLPLLQAQPKAAVVNVSSVLAYLPLAGSAVYCATKSALHSFTQALRIDLTSTTVQVFEVMPPAVDTDMLKGYEGPSLTPEFTAEQIVQGMEKDEYEMRIGQTNYAYWLSRIAPGYILKLMHKAMDKKKE